MKFNKQFALATAAGILILAFASVATAQYGAPSIRQSFRDSTLRRPTLSPYLDLFSRPGGTNTAYYSYVKPEMERRAQERRVQQETASLRQQLNQVSARANAAQQAGRLPTGHTTVFMNYSHYFRMPGR